MDENPIYLVVGRGRWASLIQAILLQEHRHAVILNESRIESKESSAAYQQRLEKAMLASGASVAWVCVPFGSWTPLIVAAAMHSGLDVIAECPWLCSPEITESLRGLEQKEKRLLSVHYEYCLLDEMKQWQSRFAGGAECTFNGTFEISRPAKYGSIAELQLGSHLLAMRRFAVPDAIIGMIHCRYLSVDRRSVWLERDGEKITSVDFTINKQPLIQRYIHAFESGRQGRVALFGLEFAGQIEAEVHNLL
jgi:hypothetical protein